MTATSAYKAVISDTAPICPAELLHRVMGLDFLTAGDLHVVYSDGRRDIITVEAGTIMDAKIRQILSSGSTANMNVRVLIGEGF